MFDHGEVGLQGWRNRRTIATSAKGMDVGRPTQSGRDDQAHVRTRVLLVTQHFMMRYEAAHGPVGD